MAIIDCHAHIDERMLSIDAIIAKMDRAGIDKVALIPAMNDPLPKTDAKILTLFRALMTSPLHPCARWLHEQFMTSGGDVVLGGVVVRIYPRPDNATVAGALKAHPDRFLGWIFLNPNAVADPVEELEQWRQVPGFVGVKLHPHWHRYRIEDAFDIAERCEALRLPILIHLGFGESGRWQLLTDRYPRLRLIFAHAGMPHFGRMWHDVKANRHLRVDLSSPYLSERLVRRAVRAIGPERALYGTDAPYGFHEFDHSYDYHHIKGWVERLPCRARDIDRVLGDNIEELLADGR
ncbi:MAG: amidohydrolase [Proteobacteria bacterium]|nr:amidohydrolase [Pseudomonadota bacterium]